MEIRDGEGKRYTVRKDLELAIDYFYDALRDWDNKDAILFFKKCCRKFGREGFTDVLFWLVGIGIQLGWISVTITLSTRSPEMAKIIGGKIEDDNDGQYNCDHRLYFCDSAHRYLLLTTGIKNLQNGLSSVAFDFEEKKNDKSRRLYN